MLLFWTGVDQGTMTMQGYSTFPKTPVLLEPYPQIILCHIQDICWGSYLSVEMHSVYSTAPANWAWRIDGFLPSPRHPGFELWLLNSFPIITIKLRTCFVCQYHLLFFFLLIYIYICFFLFPSFIFSQGSHSSFLLSWIFF